MKTAKDVLGIPAGLGTQGLTDFLPRSMTANVVSEAASQVKALLGASAFVQTAAQRTSSVQELAEKISLTTVGFAQPALLATTTIAALRASPVQDLAGSVSRFTVGIPVRPSHLAMATMSPAREFTESVGRLTARCALSPALGLTSALAEKMSSSLVNLHGSPLSDLVKTIDATRVLYQMPLGMGGTLDKLAEIRGRFVEQRGAPFGALGLMSFVDVAPAFALASWADGGDCAVAGLRAGGAAEDLTEDHVEVEVQAIIYCSECGTSIVAEGVKLTAWGTRLRFEAGVALCPNCVEDDSMTLSQPAFYTIDGDGLGDGKARGVLRLVRRK